MWSTATGIWLHIKKVAGDLQKCRLIYGDLRYKLGEPRASLKSQCEAEFQTTYMSLEKENHSSATLRTRLERLLREKELKNSNRSLNENEEGKGVSWLAQPWHTERRRRILAVWLIERNHTPEFKLGSVWNQIGTLFWLAFTTLFTLRGDRLHSNLSRIAMVVWLFVALIIT